MIGPGESQIVRSEEIAGKAMALIAEADAMGFPFVLVVMNPGVGPAKATSNILKSYGKIANPAISAMLSSACSDAAGILSREAAVDFCVQASGGA